MARAAFSATVGTVRTQGGLYAASGGRSTDLSAPAATADAAVATSQGLEAAVTSAVSAAAANGTISGNGTALALVQAIQTAFNLMIASQVTAKAATAATVTATAAGNVVVSFDTTAVTSRNQLKSALDAVLQSAAGDATLTP